FGCPAAEAIGRATMSFVPPACREETAEVIARVKRGERVAHFETIRLHNDGHPLHVSISVSPVLDGDGRVVAMAAVMRDIGERREAEARMQRQAQELLELNAALRTHSADAEAMVAERTGDLRDANAKLALLADEADQQRTFLASLLEHLPGGVAVVDLDLNFRIANPTYARAFGLEPHAVVGRHVFDVLPGSEAQVEGLLQGVIRTGEPYSAFSFPFSFNTPEGVHQTFWDFTYHPLRNETGEVDGVLALCMEVTPRVRLEQQVEAHARRIERDKAFLELALDHIPAGVFMVGPDHRYQWVNAAAATMGGRSREALLGRNLYDIVPDAPRPNPGLTLAFATGEVVHLSAVPMRSATGAHGWFDISYVPISTEGGEVQSVLVVALDVTARVENQRLQASQLEAMRHAAAIKDEFIAVASHELRTPLTIIHNAAKILTKGRAGELSEAQAPFATMIVRTVEHLTRLVDDLLDLQKLESGELPYTLRELDLAITLREVAGAFRPVFDAKGLTFHVEVPNGPIVARYDRDRLTQVVNNLLSNAAKFTPPGGTVALAVARGPHEVRVSVADTGIGIAAEDMDRIFDKFVQVERSLQREAGGTGLGLAIARGIVENGHDGRLEVESRLGEGSTFAVVLPAD
ncbi:MAG: PAS domain-containing protein, partial [Candidatus Sericytochromatia bacterium]